MRVSVRIAAGVGLVALGLFAALASRSRAGVPALERTEPEAPGSAPRAAPEAAGVVRTVASQPPSARSQVPRADSFDGYLELLVRSALALHRAAEQDDLPTARAEDSRLRSLVTELFNRIPDAGTQALARRCRMVGHLSTLPLDVRRRVLNRLVRFGIEEHWRLDRFHGDRRRTEDTVSQILPCLAGGPVLAVELGTELLGDQPYLGSAHEVAVLDLMHQSLELPFLQEVSVDLLLTLWRNLESRGERGSASLGSLARLWLEDGNPSRRIAAFRHLLTSDDARLRELALQQALATADGEVCDLLIRDATEHLDPTLALQVVERLAPHASGGLTAAVMSLGHRAPEALAKHYEELLETDGSPALRAELVSGFGFGGDLPLAERAFREDADPEVRSRALLVLAARAPQATAIQAMQEALDRAPQSAPHVTGPLSLACSSLSQRLDGELPPDLLALIARIASREDLLPLDRERLLALGRGPLPGR